MRKLFITLFLATILVSVAMAGNLSGPLSYEPTTNGIVIRQQTARLRILFVTPDVVRVSYSQDGTLQDNDTIVCLPRADRSVHFDIKEAAQTLTLATDSIEVIYNKETDAITFYDAATGRLLLSEPSQPRHAEPVALTQINYDQNTRNIQKTADGEKETMMVESRDTIGYSRKYRNAFIFQADEGLYGLGSHMEDYMNLKNKTLYLCQHNLKAMVPVINSTKGYGLLFDAGCGMIFSDKPEGGYVEMEAAQTMDYYFMKGATMDRVVAQYRMLTGATPMLPLYMFGYVQSKERYKSSAELIQTVAEYRRRHVPLDVIVQDWYYWPVGWGYLKMNPKYYPDRQLLTDSLHAMNAKLMISIWPNPTNCPQTDDFKSKGFLLKGSNYDAFNPAARRYYWKYVSDEFFSKGFDAWWCDCSEPVDADWHEMPKDYSWDSHEMRWRNNLALLSDILGAERSSLYSIYHARGIYENQRLATLSKRVVNLTRSSYAGQQRYATITWNGDTSASWASFARQIPAGLNFMATGCNYWTVDVGTFFTGRDKRWFRNGDFEKGVEDLGYREFYTRMFQYATFLPILRSHGTDTPREIWRFGNPGEMFYDAIEQMITLRYRLLPYIYSMAGRVDRDNYTMSRALAFDFANDTKVLDIKDQFMFGPAFLVCPVTSPMYYEQNSTPLPNASRQRSVYLPAASAWFDYWTGQRYEGGDTIMADAPLNKIPLFVRAGSVIPAIPVVQSTNEAKEQELTVHIYPGANGSFLLYEDAGDGYDYEKGGYATIQLSWNEAKHRFSIGKRHGSFADMNTHRKLSIQLHQKKGSTTRVVNYKGKAVSVTF